jgi:phospholipid/cholesterol/gamma-HCH transport system substrate-binding protein
MSFRFKHLEKIVGVFLTVVILVIVAVIIMIGRERRWFEKQYQYNTKFLRGEGISLGMQVAIKGIQIGEVKSVFLNEDNWIDVSFSVYQEYAERIRKDSVVKRRSPLIGSKVLEIIPGEKDMPLLANGSYVWSEDTEQGERILAEKLKGERPDQMTRLMNNLEKLTYNLSAEDGSLEPTLAKIQEFFTMLTAKDQSLPQTLASLERITKSIEKKQGSIGKIMYDDYELYNNIVLLLENLNKTVSNFEELSAALSDTSPEIKAAIERSNRTMNEAIGLIQTLKQNFFVRGFSSKKEIAPLPIDSTEREGGYAPTVEGYEGRNE